jgi:uncharacterized protein (TIGR02996 family)
VDDERALLGGILSDPGADLPRLVYADWLEERGGTAECDGCGGTGRSWSFPEPQTRCVPCSGTGRVPDGRPARAEFVRLQCELADAPRAQYGRLDPWAPHRRREAELIGLHGHEWAGPAQPLHGQFRRGFVEEVRAPLAALFGGECPECTHLSANTRSRLRMEGLDCSLCSGTGRTPGAAPALFAAHPVTSVVVTDREPTGYRGHLMWCRSNYGVGVAAWFLPEPLFDALSGGQLDPPSEASESAAMMFPTRELALSALSRAAVRLGRSLAVGWTHRGKCKRCGGMGTIEQYEGAMPDAECPVCRGERLITRPGLPPLDKRPFTTPRRR